MKKATVLISANRDVKAARFPGIENKLLSRFCCLANVFQGVHHTFYKASFAKHNFVTGAHYFVLYIAFNFSNLLHSVKKNFLKTDCLTTHPRWPCGFPNNF